MDISRQQAEEILRNDSVPNNTFLVRKQGKNEGHAISIKYELMKFSRGKSFCSLVCFRHNNEVYHIRIYTREVDGAIKHFLVDSLLFDSLQVGQIFSVSFLDLICLVFNSILSNPFIRRSISSCKKFIGISDCTCLST